MPPHRAHSAARVRLTRRCSQDAAPPLGRPRVADAPTVIVHRLQPLFFDAQLATRERITWAALSSQAATRMSNLSALGMENWRSDVNWSDEFLVR